MTSIVQQIMQRLDRIEQSLMCAKPVLDLDGAAIYTGYSRAHLYRLVGKRELPYYKKGYKLYFKKDELEQWMMENKIQSKSEIECNAATYIATHK